MQAPLPTQVIGCIGKCTTDLTVEELDQITDNINKTLSHPKGRKIFKKYLERCSLESSLECLELYEVCSEFLAKELNQSRSKGADPETLNTDVMTVREIAENLDGVPQIDMALMKQFNEALTSKDKDELLAVLNDTRNRARDYLRGVHENFKRYVLEPCPMTRK